MGLRRTRQITHPLFEKRRLNHYGVGDGMDISIIIPTFNEGKNVQVITERLKEALLPLNRSFDIYFMDDSTDRTPDRLSELAAQYAFVHFIHRTGNRGLAKAVVEGLQLASGKIVIVMDADLQHPPELIPEIIDKIESGYEMVIPSRFVPGGSDGGLNGYRRFISWTGRMLARLALKRIRGVSDPTSGYFAVRKTVIAGKTFHPIGWKVMLELIVRAHIDKIAEIPYRFDARSHGSSKMNAAESLKYVLHLFRLVWASEEDRRFYLFCMVGLSGVAVNLAVYQLLLAGHVHVLLAFIVSSLVSMLGNFFLNQFFTWKMRPPTNAFAWMPRLIKYVIVSCSGIGVSSAIVSLVHYFFHFSPILSGILGIVGGVFWNFLLNDRWTFNARKTNVLSEVHLLEESQTVIHHVKK
ncbi:glycosyltransferase family 2 protein [Sporolactobacillus sp. THM7-7]|nr:glycosyltransferase family 2 protein [Sporolactobacillus sp. THM7-7]